MNWVPDNSQCQLLVEDANLDLSDDGGPRHAVSGQFSTGHPQARIDILQKHHGKNAASIPRIPDPTHMAAYRNILQEPDVQRGKNIMVSMVFLRMLD